MIKYFFSLSLIVILLSGCYHENKVNPDKPETFLSFDKMTEILTDIQLAEGIIVHNRSVHTNMDNEYKDSLYTQIFRHYGITVAIFKENVNYYNSDPAKMEDIYEVVLANLSKMQSEIERDTVIEEPEAEAKEENVKTDTIK